MRVPLLLALLSKVFKWHTKFTDVGTFQEVDRKLVFGGVSWSVLSRAHIGLADPYSLLDCCGVITEQGQF